MNIKHLLIIIFSFTLITEVSSQGICGTIFDDEAKEILQSNIKRLQEFGIDLRASIHVPVRYHRVANLNNEGAVDLSDVLDAHDRLNRYFFDMDMQFFLSEENDLLTNAFPNNALYQDPRGSSASIVMRGRRSSSAMNVFCVGNIPPREGQVGTVLGFYSGGSNDWIVMRNSQMSSTSNTLGHEAGHFFSLAHPHLGWEDCPAEPGDGNAPVRNCGGVLVERADGSNCRTSGDFLCDTPADYNGINISCRGTFPTILDPIGEPIAPMGDNIMSYFSDCVEFKFTNEQKGVAITDYQSARRNYLRPNLAPAQDSITSPPLVSFPIDGDVIDNGSTVTVTWEEDPNATHYLVTWAEGTRLVRNTTEELVTTNEFTFPALEDNEKYTFKVRSFNKYWTPPAAETEDITFEMGITTAVTNISEVNVFNVRPNPVEGGNFQVYISLAEIISESSLTVMDVMGRTIYQQNLGTLSAGGHILPVSVDNIVSGQYIVVLRSDNRAVHQRIIVE